MGYKLCVVIALLIPSGSCFPSNFIEPFFPLPVHFLACTSFSFYVPLRKVLWIYLFLCLLKHEKYLLQVISLFLRSKHRESRGDNKYSGEISVEESCGLLISPCHVLLCLALLISDLTCTYCNEIWHTSILLPSCNIAHSFFLCKFC